MGRAGFDTDSFRWIDDSQPARRTRKETSRAGAAKDSFRWIDESQHSPTKERKRHAERVKQSRSSNRKLQVDRRKATRYHEREDEERRNRHNTLSRSFQSCKLLHFICLWKFCSFKTVLMFESNLVYSTMCSEEQRRTRLRQLQLHQTKAAISDAL